MKHTQKVPLAFGIVFLLLVPGLGNLAMPVDAAGSRSTLYVTDFEGGAPGWTHGGAKDEWALGTPSSGPGGCHSGIKCWGTTLNDTYAPNANEWLQSPSIDLSGANSATLEYWQFYDLSNLFDIMIDYGYLEISSDNGSYFKPIMNFTNTGPDQTWNKNTADLKGFLGSKILVRFRLVSDDFFESSGWFIDDFKITVNETAPSGPGHDLAVTGGSASPPTPNAGQTVHVTIQVSNVGTYDEKGVPVYFTVQDASDMSQVYSDVQKLDLVLAGSIYKVAYFWTPKNPGLFILTGKVSLDGDSNTKNDTFSFRLKVGTFPHDIAIVDMKYSPLTPKVGTLTTISVTVKNLGSSKEEKIPVHLSIMDSTDTLVFEETKPIKDFQPGAAITVDFSWTPKVADLFHARAKADPKADPTPDNNVADLFILVSKKGIDMTVIEVKVNPKDEAPMVRRTIKAQAMNIGDTNATSVSISYTVLLGQTQVSQGNTTLSVVAPGEIKVVTWQLYPDTPGVYTVKVQVAVTGDQEPDNDVMTTTFTVHSVYQDVGIEALNIAPRDGPSGTPRTILIEVGNYGDIPETFRVTLRVSDPSAVQILNKDFDLNLGVGQRANLTAEAAPTTLGNYTITATTYLSKDSAPQNDMMTNLFLVSALKLHDLGLETIGADPRTSYTNSPRALTATVSNNGNFTQDGLIEFSIYDSTKNLRSYFNRSLRVDPRGLVTATGLFTPTTDGSFDLVVTVKITNGDTDQQPGNDRMNLTIIAIPQPPSIDLSVHTLAFDPDPGSKGKEMTILVLINNLGVDPAQGSVTLTIEVPSSTPVTLDLPIFVGPKGIAQPAFKYTPTVSGNYNVVAKVKVTGLNQVDANSSNDQASKTFTILDPGAKDASVTSLTVTNTAGCSKTFKIKATVQNKGSISLGTVPVRLTVTGNGLDKTYDTNVVLVAGGSEQANFNISVPSLGRYVFSVRSMAPSDGVPSNDAMSAYGEACSVGKTKTHVDTGLATWPFALLLIIIGVVAVIMYEWRKDRQRGALR